ncbi:MAG TPA: hypothetical protein VJC37_07915 [Planctomycetota bacterium]|nr:hypothetical protein [Planctomycetota bacterium]
MKKPTFLLWVLHFFMLSIGLGLLIWSLYTPWATGQGSLGLINRTAYVYNEPALYFPFWILIAIIVVAFVFGLLSLLRPAGFSYGLVVLFAGIIASVLGLYIWGRIETSDVYLLFKLAEVKPDLGILFMILGGGMLFLDGLIYLK